MVWSTLRQNTFINSSIAAMINFKKLLINIIHSSTCSMLLGSITSCCSGGMKTGLELRSSWSQAYLAAVVESPMDIKNFMLFNLFSGVRKKLSATSSYSRFVNNFTNFLLLRNLVLCYIYLSEWLRIFTNRHVIARIIINYFISHSTVE